jgi:ATP-dependent DNA helicase RecQ
LLQQGLLSEAGDSYPILRLNRLSAEVLKKQRVVEVAIPPARQLRERERERRVAAASSRLPELEPESMGLFQHLRELRKQLSEAQGVPPYVIFSDNSLRVMAQQRPQSERHFAHIPGVGSRKLEAFFLPFTDAIREYCEAHDLAMGLEPPEETRKPPKETAPRVSAGPSTKQTTLDLYKEGRSIEEIASERNLKPTTIVDHLAELLGEGEDINVEPLIRSDHYNTIIDALHQVGDERLKPVKELLGDDYSYEEIKLVRAHLRRTSQ